MGGGGGGGGGEGGVHVAAFGYSGPVLFMQLLLSDQVGSGLASTWEPRRALLFSLFAHFLCSSLRAYFAMLLEVHLGTLMPVLPTPNRGIPK